MGTKNKVTAKNLAQILDLLNQSLQIEYSLIIHYPRLASAIRDEESRKSVLKLGSDSIKHADVVADAIGKLGGTPIWSFSPFPTETDMVKIFQRQLEKEKQALQLHRQSAGLAPNRSLSGKFAELAKEEEWHIRLVENILSMLSQSSPA